MPEITTIVILEVIKLAAAGTIGASASWYALLQERKKQKTATRKEHDQADADIIETLTEFLRETHEKLENRAVDNESEIKILNQKVTDLTTTEGELKATREQVKDILARLDECRADFNRLIVENAVLKRELSGDIIGSPEVHSILAIPVAQPKLEIEHDTQDRE